NDLGDLEVDHRDRRLQDPHATHSALRIDADADLSDVLIAARDVFFRHIHLVGANVWIDREQAMTRPGREQLRARALRGWGRGASYDTADHTADDAAFL